MKIQRVGDYTTGFKYYQNNKEITNQTTIDNIKLLKIPPAYQDVIIINTKKILAFGYDSKGRKQVIYHPDFVKRQSEKKYDKILESMKLFEKIKNKVLRDIKSTDAKTREIAMIIFLIINCGFRIGNEKYEKTNQSYGLTTLKFSHLKFLDRDKLEIDFIGKKGVHNHAICDNKYIFQYLKEKQNNHKDDNVFYDNDRDKKIRSVDVNEYLKAIDSTIKITSKDLRTWNANNLFIKFFKDKNIQTQRNPVKRAIEQVAEKLHNTYSICKKSYISPKIIEYAEKLVEK